MKKFFAFVFVSAFFCASFAENFQYAYTVNVQNESGAGYNLEISYPVFGGKLKAVDEEDLPSCIIFKRAAKDLCNELFGEKQKSPAPKSDKSKPIPAVTKKNRCR